MKQNDSVTCRKHAAAGRFMRIVNVLSIAALCLFLCLGTSFQATAQVKRITGQVVDEKTGSPLAGATVIVEGTTAGTVSGADGRFAIDAADNNTLKIFFLGYKPVDRRVGASSHIEVRLQEDAAAIEELVVVGYGAQKKVNVTGAVATVDLREIEGKPVPTLTEALQGTTPGLIITQPSSKPGSRLNINIRGLNTIHDNNPLVYIDGIEGDIQAINPSDVEQISILKDASAAIYGSRAANGVILITTKRGGASRLTVNYEFRYGFQEPTGLPKIADSWVYAELRNEALINSDLAPEFTADQIAAFRNGTAPNCKWLYEIYKNYAPLQSHNVSITGGEKQTTYFISAGYNDQESLFKNNDNFGMKRLNFRVNVAHEISDKFKISANAAYVRNEVRNTASYEEWIIEQATRTPPIYEIKIGDKHQYPQSYQSNPLARLEKGGYNLTSYDDLSGVINGELKLYKGLSLTAMGGAHIVNNRSHTNKHAIIEDSSTDISWQMGESASRSCQLTSNILLNYNQTIGKHTFTLMGGFTYDGLHNNNFYTDRGADGTLYPAPGYDVIGGSAVGSSILRMTNSGGADDKAVYSIVGRATYNYDEKYLLDFNLRNDYSSIFARGNRSGVFPSVSAGWRISQEKFYGGLERYIPSLKLRASWGLLGNDRIGLYSYMSNIGIQQNGYVFGGKPVSTLSYGAANEKIKWEKTRMFNVGIDVGLLRNNLNLSFDFFNNRTRDILLSLPIPSTFGGGTPQQNAGVVGTNGWEFLLNYNFRTGAFSHKIMANVSDSWNKVISLKGEEKIDEVRILREGFPIWAYYAYLSDGFFQNDQEVLDGPRTSFITKPGDIRYIDRNDDGEISPEDDRFIQGTRDPRYTFGFSYGVEFKGIDLSVFLQGVAKRTALLRGESLEAFHNDNTGPVYEMHIDRWTPSNPNASYPRLTANTSEGANNYQYSDFWLRDASYLRIKNIQLGYTFPTRLTQKVKISHLRVFASVQNPFTFSKMKGTGWDPEFGEGSGRVFPVTTIYSFGLDLRF